MISIHALVKRATQATPKYHHTYSHFNPRPREEGDIDGFQTIGKYTISIHALVKRATKNYLIGNIFRIISIHALVKRATIFGYAVIYRKCNFNPRPREEGDTGREQADS